MPIDPEARARLMSLIEEKRLDLGITLREFADSAGISYEALRNFRSGNGTLRPLTQRKIETALGWPRGAVGRVLEGREESAPKIPPDIEAAIRRSGDLTQAEKDEVRRAVEQALTGRQGDADPDVTLHGALGSRPPSPSRQAAAASPIPAPAQLSPPQRTPAPAAPCGQAT
jgi:transcriptional regulator with XRE-family HTH domain